MRLYPQKKKQENFDFLCTPCDNYKPRRSQNNGHSPCNVCSNYAEYQRFVALSSCPFAAIRGREVTLTKDFIYANGTRYGLKEGLAILRGEIGRKRKTINQKP